MIYKTPKNQNNEMITKREYIISQMASDNNMSSISNLSKLPMKHSNYNYSTIDNQIINKSIKNINSLNSIAEYENDINNKIIKGRSNNNEPNLSNISSIEKVSVYNKKINGLGKLNVINNNIRNNMKANSNSNFVNSISLIKIENINVNNLNSNTGSSGGIINNFDSDRNLIYDLEQVTKKTQKPPSIKDPSTKFYINNIFDDKNGYTQQINSINLQSTNSPSSIIKIKKRKLKLEKIILSNNNDPSSQSNNSNFLSNLSPITNNTKYYSKNKCDTYNNYKYNSCLLCSKLYHMNNLFSAKGCNHYLCKYCYIKYIENEIYENELLENNTNFNSNGLNNDKSSSNIDFIYNYLFKCPVYTCDKFFSFSINNYFNSEKDFYNFIRQLEKNNNKKQKNINKSPKNQNLPNKNLPDNEHLNNKRKIINKNLSHHNVLFINNAMSLSTNYNIFTIYSIHKKKLCPKCKLESLYTNETIEYFKCLNCFNTICKYCYKEYDSDHLNIYTKNHCRIHCGIYYYKKRKKNKEKLIIRILISMFFVFSGWMVVLIGGIKWIVYGVNNVIKKIFGVKRIRDVCCNEGNILFNVGGCLMMFFGTVIGVVLSGLFICVLVFGVAYWPVMIIFFDCL